ASCLTGIPWSFTAHRWDIHENNLLLEKVKSATFIRAINQNGKNEIINIIKEKSLNHKIFVIHMGVEIPSTTQRHPSSNGIFTILCAANLVPVKGHKYLIEACNILQKNGIDFKCYIAGEGYLEKEMIAKVNKLKLNNRIQFLGKLPHDRLIKMFEEKTVDLVVLPSIVTTSGEKEGIPVTLMEAMAHNLPVISTSTGGIPELIKDAGVLVEAGNPTQLAICIIKFITNRDYYTQISESCREKVADEYNISNIVKKILKKIRNK
ncbi:MAG: glycosyltransferase family 4 protein, partial [bacterium]